MSSNNTSSVPPTTLSRHVYLAGEEKPRGFEPPERYYTVSLHFEYSVSRAINAIEDGVYEIPATGIFVQSAQLSRNLGYPVWYRLWWAYSNNMVESNSLFSTPSHNILANKAANGKFNERSIPNCC